MPPSTRRKAQDPAGTYAASKIGDIGTFKANKRQKLQNQNAELQEHGSDTPAIFKGYTITSLGRTNPDANKLREMVVLHGGTWKEEKDGGTIIVTTHVPPKKRDEWRNRKMVTPEWILESINRGKVEDWTEYRVGGAGDSQATLSFGGSIGLKVMSSSRSQNEAPYKSGFKKKVKETPEMGKSSNSQVEIPPSDDEDGEMDKSENTRRRNPRTLPEDETRSPTSPNGTRRSSTRTSAKVSGNTIRTPRMSLDKKQPRTQKTKVKKSKKFYNVECVIGVKKDSENENARLIHVRWEGYPDSDKYWEPEANLREDMKPGALDEMIREYEERKRMKALATKTPSARQTAVKTNDSIVKTSFNGNKHKSWPTEVADSTEKPNHRNVEVADSTEKAPLPAGFSFIHGESFSTVHFSQEAQGDDDFEDTPIAKQTKPPALNSSVVKESVYDTDNILTSPVPGAAPELPSSQFYTQDLVDAQIDAQLQPRRLSEVSIRESIHSTPSPPSSPVPTKSKFPSFQNSNRTYFHNDSIARQLLAEEDIEPSSAQRQLDIEYEDIEPSSAQKQPDVDHEDIEDEDIEDNSQVTPRPRQLQSSPTPEISIQKTPFRFSPAPKSPGAGISSNALDADWLDESFQEDAQLINTPFIPAASRFVERKRPSTNIPSPILESETFDDDAQLINTPYITAASRFMERKRPSPILESPIQTVKKVKYGHPNPEDLINKPTGTGNRNLDLDEDASLFEDDFILHSAQPQVHNSNPRASSNPPRRFDTHSSPPSKESTPDIPQSPVVSYPEAAQVRMRNARTPEEFNQALLTLPAARDRCCLNPNFLTHFFTTSRLHHLSTWKLSLRQSVAAALASHPSQRNLRPRKTRYILHIDFDSFFCSVSLLSHPELKGKPVAVCHGSSKHSTTSDIASCNYVAREKGVKNGMWLERARKLCPALVTLPYDFEAYKEASRIFYDVVLGVGPERIQAVSVDEVLVDCSNLICDNYSATVVRELKVMELAERIRNEVREKTRCEVSVGVGTNVLLARVALRKAKPAGQAMVTEATSREVMGMLDVRDLPGIGGKTAEGISQHWQSSTVADIRRISKEELQRQLGEKTGQRVYDMCRGIDTTEVGEAEVVRESLSVAVNWGVRFYKKEQFVNFLSRLAEYVEEKLKLEGLKGHKLTFSIAKRAEGQPFETTKFLGCGKCDMISKTEKFVESTNSAKAIMKACLGIYNRLTIQVGDIRGLTIQMTELEEDTGKSKQQTLQFQRIPKTEKISPNPKNQTNTTPSAQPQKFFPNSESNQSTPPKPAAPSRKGKEKATSYTPENPSSPSVFDRDKYPIDSPDSHTRQWPLKNSSSGSPQNRLDNIDFSNPAVKEFLVSPTRTNRYTHPSNFRSPAKSGTSKNTIGTPSKSKLFAAFQKSPPKRTAADPAEDDEDPFVPFTPNQIPSSAQPIFGTPISPRTRASLLAAAATQVTFEPPAEANPPPIIPHFYDAAGKDITDWLFLPLSEGGAGLDKEIFFLHTKSEQEHEVKKLLKGKKEAEERVAAAAREAERAVAARQNTDRVREGDARNWRRKGELWLSIGRPVKKEHMHSVNMALARWAKEVEQPITREDREEVIEFLKGLVEEEEMDKAGVFLRFLKGLARDMPEWRWLAEVCELTVREAARKRLGWENVVF